MIRVDIEHAQPGMTLALPVYHPLRRECTLLQAGFVLDNQMIRRLRELRQTEVWIQYPGLDSIKRFVNPNILHARQQLTMNVARTLEVFQHGIAARLEWRDYQQVMGGLIEALVSDPTAALFIDELSNRDDPLLRHSSNVCFLSTIIGLKLQGYLVKQRKRLEPTHAADIVTLGIGAMLHDVGMLHVDPAVVARWYKERDETDAAWQEHVHLGYEIVSGHMEPSASAVVLHHHQYYDGSGFPKKRDWQGRITGLRGDEIHVFPRIVTVADQFQQIRARGGSTPWPTVRALKHMVSGSMIRRFDPVTLRTLLEVVPAYSPGTTVTLSTGQRGIVIDWRPTEPCRPKVAIPAKMDVDGDPEEALRHVVDLLAEEEVSIIAAEGWDVSADNFTIPATLRPRRAAGLQHWPRTAA